MNEGKRRRAREAVLAAAERRGETLTDSDVNRAVDAAIRAQALRASAASVAARRRAAAAPGSSTAKP
ncbi:hypothetical protein [Parafrankia discariae]|uniref:hypothetical protein n=1 Tax=Parafrankia discariae TaxID=365528 RepID=UPI00037B3626|nr:hypothetical protein [Parafrankia discariae]